MIGALSTKISSLSAAPEGEVDSVIEKEVEASPCRAAAFLQPAVELTVEVRPLPGAVTCGGSGCAGTDCGLKRRLGGTQSPTC